jgi:hypothetical protein
MLSHLLCNKHLVCQSYCLHILHQECSLTGIIGKCHTLNQHNIVGISIGSMNTIDSLKDLLTFLKLEKLYQQDYILHFSIIMIKIMLWLFQKVLNMLYSNQSWWNLKILRLFIQFVMSPQKHKLRFLLMILAAINLS